MRVVPGDQQLPRSQEVFISYSRKDKDFARRLDQGLKSRRREAWVDWEDIRPTEEWMRSIYGAIECADTFVFVLTPDSVASVVCGLRPASETKDKIETNDLEVSLSCGLAFRQRPDLKSGLVTIPSSGVSCYVQSHCTPLL